MFIRDVSILMKGKKMRKLENLKPERVFYWFEEICRIPHGSGNTRAISDFIADFGHEHGLRVYQDEMNNVVLYKNGTSGYENSAPVILQGHMDMVCEKTPDSDHDFLNDPLDLYIEDGFVRAHGTTLGGDDGIYVAMALAILEDDSLAHPPIEAVFTVDEEIGLLGAEGLDTSVLSGRRMINLDSEADGILWVASAGGVSTRSSIPVKWTDSKGFSAEITIDGLVGGHSGAEIDKNRASAVMLMGRLMFELENVCDYGLVSLYGGEKENAIPRNSRAEILMSEDASEAVTAACEKLKAELRQEYAGTDENIDIRVTVSGEKEAAVLHPTSQSKVIFFLRNVPWGIRKMSGTVKDLVETSNNAGIIRLNEQEFTAECGVRSSVGSAKKDLAGHIRHLTEFLGGECTFSGDYPAWEYRADSPLRDVFVSVFKRVNGHEPVVTAVHAGLECGLFYGKMPSLDCVSLGPDIIDIHTTSEHLDIASTERTYNLLCEVLKELK